MSFRWKMFISYGLLALVMSLVFYGFVNGFLEKRLVEESRQGLLTQAKLARIILSQTGSYTKLQPLSEQIATTSRARVTLINAEGKVLADSGVGTDQLAGLENHISRPEVQTALQHEIGESLRYSQTLKTDMLYIAMRCKLGPEDGLLRLALPLEHLNEARSLLHKMLGAATGGILVLALLFSMLLSNLISRPLRSMAEIASRFGVGEHGVRMPVGSDNETGYLARVLNEMAERIESQMQSLTDEKERLDTILNGIGEGLIVIDSTGRIILASPAFRNLFDLDSRPEGHLLVEVSRHPNIISAWHSVMNNCQEFSEEVRLESNGRTLLAHWVPLLNGGMLKGTVAVFLDITAIKRLETIRQDFLANVSHELRTPIAVIKGYAETLIDQKLVESAPEQASRFIETIYTHTGRLNRLLEDILILSRLETTGTSLKLESVDLTELLDRTCNMHRDKAEAKGISLSIVTLSDKLPQVLADRERVEQVLVNLLDNAIKYTSQGEIKISAALSENMLNISISDTGIGIPEKELQRVFERFYRVDAARSRELGGTGLGLAIVKHIVQLHGGTVTVQSTPGKGSVFSFTLKKA